MEYDWVVFDFGGTLTVRRKGTEPPPRRENLYGTVILEWLERMEYQVSATAADVEQLTIDAHGAVAGNPDQLDWLWNQQYYVQWFRYIYQQLGLDAGYDSEMTAAFYYMMWKVQPDLAGGGACPDVVDTLSTLKARGYRLAVLSNNNGYVGDSLVAMGIQDFFDPVLDSAREGRVKPDPVLFRELADRLESPCDRIFYVGDDYNNDVIGATQLGMGAGWINDGERELPPRAVQIRAFPELLKHLPG